VNALFLSSSLALIAAYLIVASDQGVEAKAVKLSKVKFRRFAGNIVDRSKLRDRLLELNRIDEHEYLEFRSSQIATSFLTFAVFTLLIWAKTSAMAGALTLGVISGYFAFQLIDRNLTKAVVKRRAQMDAEFPALIEMLTLSISAGQTPLNAMAAIAARSDCELATEFAVVTKDVIAGAPFHIALDAMGRRIKSVTIRRFIDAMITAMLRGAPIVEVLQRHAQESRTGHRNQIMTAAGKAEISMMIPVVFLILPVSMLFALWPSLSNLNGFM
jgi:tight adherence protein C